MTEAVFTDAFLVAAQGHPAFRIWRQLTGKAIVAVSTAGHAFIDAMLRGAKADALAIMMANPADRLIRAIDVGPPNGAADYTGVLMNHGARFELEMKGTTTRWEPHQKAWGQFIRSQGGLYLCLRPESEDPKTEAKRALAQVETAIVQRVA